MKVAVIYGGRSAEREVSLNSGEQIIQALKGLGYEVGGFDVTLRLFDELEKFSPDVVFLGLHGRYGEDGTIQGALELMGYPYVGSGVLASALAIDKAQTKRMLVTEGLPTPKHRLLNRSDLENAMEIAEEAGKTLGFPYIIKPNKEGSTIGLTLAKNVEEAIAGIQLAFKYDRVVLVEEYIKGMEVTVVVFGDTSNPEVLGIIEIIPKAELYDYNSKYLVGGSQHVLPARISAQVQEKVEDFAKRAYKIIGCQDYARVDMLIGENGPLILEVNTLPGMTSTSLVPDAARYAGYSFSSFLDRLIELAYGRTKQENIQI